MPTRSSAILLAATCAALGAAAIASGPSGAAAAVRADGPARLPSTDLLLADTADHYRVDGEYGLFVREAGRDLEVRWITRMPGAGVLEVHAGNRLVHSTTTPEGRAHAATFRRPRGSTLTLRYGAAGDPADRHETRLFLDAASRRAGASFSNVDSVFVIGDTHGEFDRVITLLRNAGVIDGNDRWSAGRGHLVLVGDIFDRGADVTRLLWFLYGLEQQALAARGRVHVVLGNHEIMVMLNDLRYVAPKEMLISHLHGIGYDRLFDPRHSVLGRWLATKPAMLRINDVLYAHGGVTPAYTEVSLEQYDEFLGAFMREDLFYNWADTTVAIRMPPEQVRLRDDFFWGPESVFWFRGYVQSDTLHDSLARVLRHFRSTLHVVGHTAVPTIEERMGGALIPVKTIPPASELLLLVREGRQGTRRYRWGLSGPPVPLAASVAGGSAAGAAAIEAAHDHDHPDPRPAASAASGPARPARSSP
jgi:hypothetical protein